MAKPNLPTEKTHRKIFEPVTYIFKAWIPFGKKSRNECHENDQANSKEVCIGVPVTIAYKEEKLEKIYITMTRLLKLIVDEYEATKNDSDICKGCLTPHFTNILRNGGGPTIVHLCYFQFFPTLL